MSEKWNLRLFLVKILLHSFQEVKRNQQIFIRFLQQLLQFGFYFFDIMQMHFPPSLSYHSQFSFSTVLSSKSLFHFCIRIIINIILVNASDVNSWLEKCNKLFQAKRWAIIINIGWEVKRDFGCRWLCWSLLPL